MLIGNYKKEETREDEKLEGRNTLNYPKLFLELLSGLEQGVFTPFTSRTW